MDRRRTRFLLLTLTILAVFLTPVAVPQHAAAQAPSTPYPAPDIKFLTLDGKTAALSDYRGKVVLLDFWATWCGPCRMEMPTLQKLHTEYQKKGLAILGVSLDRNPPVQVPPFLKNMGITYTNLADNPKDPSSAKFDVRAIPSLFLIDRKGNLVRQWRGVTPEAELVKAITGALDSKK